MGRSTKKGPFVEERLLARIERDERGQPEADGQDLVADVDRVPRDGRAHDRRPRRAQARAGLHLRVDGRPQARRVRADPDVPRPLRRAEGTGVRDFDGRSKRQPGDADGARERALPARRPAQGAAGRRPGARHARARGAGAPGVLAAGRGARHPQADRVGGRERREQPRAGRRRHGDRRDPRRRGPYPQALARPRPRPRDPDRAKTSHVVGFTEADERRD